MLRIVTVLSSLFLATACGSSNIGSAAGGDGGTGGAGSGGTGGDGGTGGTGPCGPTQRVDGRGNCLDVCINQSQCARDFECHIAIGLCLPIPQNPDPCEEASCRAGWVCPADGIGNCEPGPGYCEIDEDCVITERCDAGRCMSRAGDIVEVCSTIADCPPLMTCQLGVCFGCLADIQCIGVGPDARCFLGTCVKQDLGPAFDCLTANCGTGTRCNLTTGLCEPVCADDTDCEVPGEICAPVLNKCVVDPSCVDDNDCPGAQTCANGFGQSICTGCSDTDPCSTGLTCIIGVCLPDLGASVCDGNQCLADELCDPLDGACYNSNGTCSVDADCRPDHVCNVLICSGCSLDSDCRPNQRCLFGACLPF